MRRGATLIACAAILAATTGFATASETTVSAQSNNPELSAAVGRPTRAELAARAQRHRIWRRNYIRLRHQQQVQAREQNSQQVEADGLVKPQD
jgi:hypothetical protein